MTKELNSTQSIAQAAPVAEAVPDIDALEQIAQSWDGCECRGIGDIGAALRTEFKKLASTAQEVTKQAVPDLHSAIMSLPCNPPDVWGRIQQTGYKIGHRDARHAAAELVNEAMAAQEVTQQAATADLTAIDCPVCRGFGEVETGIGMLCCDECHGQGKIIVSRKDLAALAPTTSTVSAPDEIRNQALEEAAKVCENRLDPSRSWTTSEASNWHANAIRALKHPNKGEAA